MDLRTGGGKDTVSETVQNLVAPPGELRQSEAAQ